MGLFETLSAPYRESVRGTLGPQEFCLYDSDGDHFFASVRIDWVLQDVGMTILNVEAAFAKCVDISDDNLFEEVKRVADEQLGKAIWEVDTIKRIQQ